MGQTTWQQKWLRAGSINQTCPKRRSDSKDQRVGWRRGSFWTDWEWIWLHAEKKHKCKFCSLHQASKGHDEVPMYFFITQKVCVPFTLVFEYIYLFLFTLGCSILVLLPRWIIDFFRAGSVASALYPSSKRLSCNRYICISQGTGENRSHVRYFKQGNVLERLELHKKEGRVLEEQKGKGDTWIKSR